MIFHLEDILHLYSTNTMTSSQSVYQIEFSVVTVKFFRYLQYWYEYDFFFTKAAKFYQQLLQLKSKYLFPFFLAVRLVWKINFFIL